MVNPVSLAISTLLLAVSAVTAWLTLFRRGTVKMTQPTVIFFRPRHSPLTSRRPLAKSISTHFVVLNLEARPCNREHAWLSRNETLQNFNIWVYGERGKLVRSSGLFVGETGISADHHFLTPTRKCFPFYRRSGWMFLFTYSATQNPYGFFLSHWKFHAIMRTH